MSEKKIDNREVEQVIDLLCFMLTEANRLREYVQDVSIAQGKIKLERGFNPHVNLTLHSQDLDLFLAVLGWLRDRFKMVSFTQESGWYSFAVAKSQEFPRL